jgi:hypothetical protein
MKFNLKNRPPAMSPCSQVEEWFKGFEERQRQNLADYEKALETKKHCDKEFLACWKAISNYIKLEILGDET